MLIQSDNTTAISYVAKMGGIQSELHDKISRDIWELGKNYNFTISISHISGSNNLDADGASCLLNTHSEWSLPCSIFKQVCALLDFIPDIDAFASHLNNKLPRYFSFTADPFSEIVDAFTVSWTNSKLYCYPPCSVIGKCLRKIQQDKATVLFVAPFWPSQPCFPVWAQMLTSTPLLLLPPCPIFSTFYPRGRTSTKAQISTLFCHYFQEAMHKRHIPEDIIKIQLQGFSPSTKQSYSSVVKAWEKFCDEQQISVLQPTVPQLTSFFQHIFISKEIKGEDSGNVLDCSFLDF